jgi:hypothetical protein
VGGGKKRWSGGVHRKPITSAGAKSQGDI